MKLENVHFHRKNNETDSDLVKAVEILCADERDMLILPADAEMGCMKQDGRIIIYPHNLEGQLCVWGCLDAEDYRERPTYSEFKLKGFSYEVLHRNPFDIYKKTLWKGCWQRVTSPGVY